MLIELDRGERVLDMYSKVSQLLEARTHFMLPKRTSSSRSSKYLSHSSGTTSLKPSRKAFVCASTPLVNRHVVISLDINDKLDACVNRQTSNWYTNYIVYFSKLEIKEIIFASKKSIGENRLLYSQVVDFRRHI